MSKHVKQTRANPGLPPAQASAPSQRIDSAPLRPSGGPGEPNAMAEANGPMPTQEQIANRAYKLWEAQGKPEGVDRKNWFEAERQLRAEPK